MAIGLILGPLATLLTFALVAAGLHWLLEEPGAAARSRLTVFAPSMRNGSSQGVGGSLIRQRRYSDIPGLQQLLQREHVGERLAGELLRAGMTIRPGEYVMLRCSLALLAAIVVWIVTSMLLAAVAVAALGYLAPALYVRWRQRRRTDLFDDQLVEALVLISNSLKAGFSALQAMQAVAEEMPDPIRAEFHQAIAEIRMGGMVDEAMVKIARRIRSKDFELVVSGMVIQRQVGGNLTEIIGNVVRTVRDRHRIHREVRTLTGEQRMEGVVLGVLPLALLIVLLLLQPSYIGHMWAESMGRLLFAAGAAADVAGLLVIRKLVQIEV